LAVDTVGRHRVVRIADADDRGLDGKLEPARAARISATVRTLVVCPDQFSAFPEVRELPEELISSLAVSVHHIPLLRREGTWFLEYLVGGADLANVVKERRFGDELHLAWGQAHSGRQAVGVLGHALTVTVRVAIALIDQVRKLDEGRSRARAHLRPFTKGDQHDAHRHNDEREDPRLAGGR